MTPIEAPLPAVFLDSLANESDGFLFDNPCRVDNESLSVILPILRHNHEKRDYVTLPESKAVQVLDSGTINVVEVRNDGTEAVFLRSGTVFEGKGTTQNRTITRSHIVPAGETMKMDARCVHATHPIRGGSKFKYGGMIPLDVENKLYDDNFKPRDQGRYWSEVRNSSARMMASTMKYAPEAFEQSRVHNLQQDGGWGGLRSRILHSGSSRRSLAPLPSAGNSLGMPPASDDLAGNFAEFTKNFDEVLKKVRIREKQAGLALITQSGVETIECFDVPLSWEAMHKDAVKRMGSELVTKDPEHVFEMRPEKAKVMVVNVLQKKWNCQTIYKHRGEEGHLKIFGITSGQYVGEVVELYGTVMHLMIVRRAA